MTAAESLQSVRGVLFDAGNVLLWLDHPRMTEIVNDLGITRSLDDVAAAEMRARPKLDPLIGRAPKRESPHVHRRYVELIVEGLGVTAADADRVFAALDTAWNELWVRPPDDAHSVLRALAARGYRLGCVSNSDGQVSRRLADAGLLHLLETVTDSGDVGFEKPDPRIFALGVASLGLAVDRIAYVGDLFSVDIVGARGAGLVPVLMDPLSVWDADCVRVRSLSHLLEMLPGAPTC